MLLQNAKHNCNTGLRDYECNINVWLQYASVIVHKHACNSQYTYEPENIQCIIVLPLR